MKAQDIIQSQEGQALRQLRRNKSWQLVFVALFTALLAFFVLIVAMIEVETNAKKRDYQRLVNSLYQEINFEKERMGLSWLHTENTLTKGIRLTIASEVFEETPLFMSARARVNPRYMPYVNRLVELLNRMQLETVRQRYPNWVATLREPGDDFVVTVRVEGHTDANPMTGAGMYRSNYELSALRAYAIMELLRIYTQLPSRQFAIAGYGPFYPLNPQDPFAAENRRVEIYIVPQVIPEAIDDVNG
ncbi:cell envelope biogenesis protein OmpA [Hydrogenovibrio sp. SC-1]|uniref:OmpA/MotB family protein n=1 Tax=Hydrogenovibrio sp. SC-1 TaxID=2065820 RepID=UPI000C7CFE25|nr:OmpA family protein [Hydrogenovibrio sp. SC-1]PLA73862.1 cell envelope biogenesis protein OmpA [Hydrogenovibrio sp. SC-1]